MRTFLLLALLAIVGCGQADGAGRSTGFTSSGSTAASSSSTSGTGSSSSASSSSTSGSSSSASSSGTSSSSAGSSGTSSSSSSASTGSSGATFTCAPAQQDTRAGGGRCADLNEAWTGRGINVGYYAFRARRDVPQYSGDYSGDPGAIFTAGPTSKGVILQVIPAGAYVGLSSNGPWYDPPSGDCFPSGASCGSASRGACSDSSPPMRTTLAGFAWGYAYSGGSHMQGWIPFDADDLEFVGFDPSHPCALGPADADFEAASACGSPTACSGTNPTCAAVNACDEGQDDCGNTACGAQSGGALTPSAWRRTVHKPSGDHACTQRTPPNASVTCLANGADDDFFFVYPFGAYLYWAQNSTTKFWLHAGDAVQVYFHNRDAQGVLWDFVEVLNSGAPILTPASDGAGAGGACSSSDPSACTPCQNGGACGWLQDVFLQ